MSKLTRLLLRAVAALGLALPLVAVASSPAAADPITRFHAEHIRYCNLSFAQGTFDWNPVTTGGTPAVAVDGVLADRNPGTCQRPDVGTPFVVFTAYIDGRRVDARTFDLSLSNANSERPFTFTLSGRVDDDPFIDQVDVQVCRDFGPMLPAFTCGDTQSYHRPRIGPVE